ncbi:hypothetical protein AB0D49_19950 [Streptomyces sp. NPDC048290]|uniref:hypothetical protein n=1 Tax=Streptomyces sp. NPDC048290 TaxID=3155811 RepID=UPI0034343E8C
MAWDEWEQLKAAASERQSTGMQLNQLDPGDGSPGTRGGGSLGRHGDLKVANESLTGIGRSAHDLYNDLWDKARVAVPSGDAAAGDLTTQGFALGDGLQHVTNRWQEQLRSLMDACAQITNHLQVTRTIHTGDENFIQRQMSGIATLDAGFDERVGQPGAANPVYGAAGKGDGDGEGK